ncbi:Prolyl-tRNA synthetase [Candidatus Phytoplasma mali]|uniref:Proline--tRNA ligase n=1 Tax=Phytoplasma mali (strain AT) TaxID=482235 RepID=B3R0N8_PHYMT|nr:proline--tRNA ligase [Candidatus Phytoplasma mali]CAP18622.1 Prolyl-tRNA synthetase [Candidatus Phytoplasma mali]
MKKKLVKSITSRTFDFGKWYTDVCVKGELIAYSDVKGFIIYLPDGYFLWEQIQKFFNKELQKTNHQNVYFPLLFTENLFKKEKKHIQGFQPETAFVTFAGDKNLSEKLILRPTSEVLFSQHYEKTITSYRDLPKLYNQWCNVIRWEKSTRPFLRGKEFLWQEGHTAHANAQEAMSETLSIIKLYQKLGKELLAIPFVIGKKTELEKFAGAIETYSIESLMPDGQSLQSGTSHFLGTKFSEAFNIKFQDLDNKIKFVYQTSWGISTRLLGALVMVHGDDEGLVFPPYIAPLQIIIIPLQPKDANVIKFSNEIFEVLKNKYRVKLDVQNKNTGWKFSQYEMKGIPLRIEVGKHGLEKDEITVFTRYNFLKQQFKKDDLLTKIPFLFKNIHLMMYQKALKYLNEHQYKANNYEEFKILLKKGGYVAISISGTNAELKIKKETGATARIILEQELITDNCPITNEKAIYTALFSRAY